MDFSINKNSTLPLLKMAVIQDGRNDFQKIYELIQNSTVVFTMTDVVTGVKRIGRRPAYYSLSQGCSIDEYLLTFHFTKKDTAIPGRYVGQFDITFLDGTGTLIVPIKENLYINILDAGIKK